MNQNFYNKNPEEFFIGKRVITLRDIVNRTGVLAKGSLAIIERKRGGFNLIVDKCSCCGIQWRVTKVGPDAVELLESDNKLTELDKVIT